MVLLVTAIGGLVALAAGAVLLLSAYANFKNTTELIVESAQVFMASLETDVRQHIEPAADIVDFLVKQAENGEFDPAYKHETVLQLKGVLGGVPQLSGVAVWQPNARQITVTRGKNQELIVQTENNQQDDNLKEFLTMLRSNNNTVWNEPFRNEGKTLISVAAPLYYEEQYIGAVAAGVSVGELSSLVEELGKAYDIKGFIIYGEKHLLAHARLPEFPRTELTEDTPLFKISDLELPVVNEFLKTPIDFTEPDGNFNVRDVEVDDKAYLVLSHEMKEVGNVPWTLGAYSPSGDWDTQINRLFGSILGGIFLLILAILGAILLSRRVADPVSKTAAATLKIGNLDLDKIEPLPPSRITELNNQASAFNQMLEGLRWFETYVPRQLVRQLIKQEDTASITSQELELTVMFTDIVGFTASSETKNPADIANELNQHFEIINQCIEAEGGTLDKYIGDAVMAFWGAPDRQEDHAQRACRAALAIEKALMNSGHKQRIKIAIHTGPLIVGNIGAVGRMNYTVIGDTVNTCSRIEKLASDLDDGTGTVIMISEATANYLDETFKLQKAGQFSVKGRKKPITTFRLLAEKIHE